MKLIVFWASVFLLTSTTNRTLLCAQSLPESCSLKSPDGWLENQLMQNYQNDPILKEWHETRRNHLFSVEREMFCNSIATSLSLQNVLNFRPNTNLDYLHAFSPNLTGPPQPFNPNQINFFNSSDPNLRNNMSSATEIQAGLAAPLCLTCEKNRLGPIFTPAQVLSPFCKSAWGKANSIINPQCVGQALPRTRGFGARIAYQCSSETSTPINAGFPCLSNNYRDFVTFTLNIALACLSSPEVPLSAEVLFEKINNESGFAGFISSNAGKGTGQMTSIALREAMNREHRGRQTIDSLLNQNSGSYCNSIKQIVSTTAPVPNSACEGICSCQYLAPGAGMARNAVASVGLFAYYKKDIIDRLRRELGNHPQLSEFADIYALIRYSRHGRFSSGLMSATIPLIKTNRWTPQQLRENLQGRAPYLREVSNKMREVFSSQLLPLITNACVVPLKGRQERSAL